MKQGNIGKLVATIRQLLFVARMERKIRKRVFPHLNQEANPGYAFKSEDEMVESYMFAALDMQVDLKNILGTAADMPRPYGDIFCYVAYCDLHERMKMYQKLADKLVQAQTGDAQTVAVPA